MPVQPRDEPFVGIVHALKVADVVAGGHHASAERAAALPGVGRKRALHDAYGLRLALQAALHAGEMDVERPCDGVAGFFHVFHEPGIDNGRLDVAVEGLFLEQKLCLLHVLHRDFRNALGNDELGLAEQSAPVAQAGFTAVEVHLLLPDLEELLLEGFAHGAGDIGPAPRDELLHLIQFEAHLLVIFEHQHQKHLVMGIDAVIVAVVAQGGDEALFIVEAQSLLGNIADSAHFPDGVLRLRRHDLTSWRFAGVADGRESHDFRISAR